MTTIDGLSVESIGPYAQLYKVSESITDKGNESQCEVKLCDR